jgi:hypothetical protein
MKIVVIYNRPSVMGIQGPKGELLKLLAGANVVDFDLWKATSSHPIVKSLIDEGVIEFKLPSEKTKPEVYLQSVSNRDAIDLVKKTIDAELLKTWAQKETRKPVVKALEEQIKALNAPPVYRERTKEDDEGEPIVKKQDTDELPPDDTDDAE